MPKGAKSTLTDKHTREEYAHPKGNGAKGVARPEAQARAWATANKLHGGARAGAGRKVPSGPVGGLGRKTNLSRSS